MTTPMTPVSRLAAAGMIAAEIGYLAFRLTTLAVTTAAMCLMMAGALGLEFVREIATHQATGAMLDGINWSDPTIWTTINGMAIFAVTLALMLQFAGWIFGGAKPFLPKRWRSWLKANFLPASFRHLGE